MATYQVVSLRNIQSLSYFICYTDSYEYPDHSYEYSDNNYPMSTVCEEFVPTMLDNQVTQQPDWNESNSQQKTRLEKNSLEKTTVSDKPPEKMVMQKDNQVIRII